MHFTEAIRQFIRGLIGYRNPVYSATSSLINSLRIIQKEGFSTFKKIRHIQQSDDCNSGCYELRLSNLKFPFYVRPCTSDVGTVIHTIIREEYGHFSFPEHLEWMIDAGAYIGDTSAYFLSKFPELKIVALEPTPASYELTVKNLDPYNDRVFVENVGLFYYDGRVSFSGDNTGAGIVDSGSLDSSSIEITCKSIPSLLSSYGIERLSLLKLDIEGGEEAIFENNPEEWLDRVDILVIETHGDHIEKLMKNVLTKNGFKIDRYRSVWFCQKMTKIRL